jgi:hypothetical protein
MTIVMRARVAGLAYVEVVVAVLLVAVCIVPAANAIKNATGAPAVAALSAQSLACVKSQMESVLAEPYPKLLAAASASISVPAAAYSQGADAACPARNVYIARYNGDTPATFSQTDTHLLFVRVNIANATLAPMPLTTLVSR